MVLLTFLCLGLWWQGEALILGESASTLPSWLSGEVANTEMTSDEVAVIGEPPIKTIASLAYHTSPSVAYAIPSQELGWRLLLGTGWSLLIWTPIALLLARQGALLTAGRPMMSLRSGLELGLARMLRAWLTALVPTACLLMIALLIFLLGKVGQWTGRIAAMEVVMATALALIALAGGLLAFGAHFAIPLGWAALANEQNPDPLDSLSRGYEYLLRRPLHLAAYLLLSVVILIVIGGLAAGVAWAANELAGVVLSGNDGAQSLVQRITVVLNHFPIAVLATLGWGLIGGVYLLLRRDAGGQDVEDIWMPPVKPRPRLPSVPNS